MEEFLRFFVQPNAHTPYYISLSGITYPDPNYHLNKQTQMTMKTNTNEILLFIVKVAI
jgi:hypothetical protein